MKQDDLNNAREVVTELNKQAATLDIFCGYMIEDMDTGKETTFNKTTRIKGLYSSVKSICNRITETEKWTLKDIKKYHSSLIQHSTTMESEIIAYAKWVEGNVKLDDDYTSSISLHLRNKQNIDIVISLLGDLHKSVVLYYKSKKKTQ